MSHLRVFALMPVLLASVSPLSAEPETRTISGQLSYMQRIALGPDSLAVVEFRNDDDEVLGETRFNSEGRQVPLPFALHVPINIDGQVQGAIWSAGRPTWVSDPVAIEAGDEPLEIDTLLLQPFTPMGFSTVMRCGETDIEIGFIDDHARLRVDGETIDLFPVPAASGAKFTAPDDPDTFFWSRGTSALVSLAGERLPECVSAVPTKAPSFRGRGNEPGWSLRITGDQLQLSLDYGKREIETQLPPPASSDGVKVYQLPDEDINIRISDQLCNDSMTGMPYPSTVALEVQGQRLNGCGGEPRALLEGPEWTIKALAGEPLPDDVSVTIQFLDDDRVAGNSGCNRFMGGYELTGEGISFGRLAGTMMACPEPQMQTEQRFLEQLQAVVRFEVLPDQGLALVTTDGKQILAER